MLYKNDELCSTTSPKVKVKVSPRGKVKGNSKPVAKGAPGKAAAKEAGAPMVSISIHALILWYYSEWKTASGYSAWKASMLSSNFDVCVVCEGGGVLL